MSESQFYRETKKGLDKSKSMIRLNRVENQISNGFPDVFYSVRSPVVICGTNGVIELKFLKSWPVRPTTVVKLEHFTKEQKSFLFENGQIAQKGHFLYLKVDTDYLLYEWKKVYKIGNLTRYGMIDLALHYTHGHVDYDYLADLLTFN